MAPVKVSLPSVAPRGQLEKVKRPPALGLAGVPTAKNDPKVTPVAVGTGVGSLVVEVEVTLVNG